MDTITLVHYNAKGYGGFYNSKICDENKNKVFTVARIKVHKGFIASDQKCCKPSKEI